MKACSVEGCGGTFRITSGYCNKHYLRFKRKGSATAGGTYKGQAFDFFMSALTHEGNECLTWPFLRDNHGYARMRFEGENRPVHRIVCEIVHGEPPAGREQATHSCGKGHEACINPTQDDWGSGFKNQQDRVPHGTSNRGERCGSHKLTESEALEIHTARGEHPSTLASRYGVSVTSIHDIWTGRTWAWLTGETNPKERDIDGNLLAVG